MRFTPTTRLVAVAVLLLVGTAVIWWFVGFPIGNALLDGASAWRSSFGYGPLGLMRLFALALVVPVTMAIVTSASPQTRWLAIAAVAFGAVMLYGDKSRGDIVGVVLFVLATASSAIRLPTPGIVFTRFTCSLASASSSSLASAWSISS